MLAIDNLAHFQETFGEHCVLLLKLGDTLRIGQRSDRLRIEQRVELCIDLIERQVSADVFLIRRQKNTLVTFLLLNVSPEPDISLPIGQLHVLHSFRLGIVIDDHGSFSFL